MLRRTAVAALLGAVAQGRPKLLGNARGAALLLDFRTRRPIAEEGSDFARWGLLPPGSTVKPFSLYALIEADKIDNGERFPCPVNLSIGGRSFACSHPPLGAPVGIATAIAYSCNCFVAHFAERFAPGELARPLVRFGFVAKPALTSDSRRLQALGEDRVLVTPLALLMAYHRLASLAARPDMAPIVEGLEGAVEYGTAQLARVPGLRVGGKTGSVMTKAGAHAWFAGFAPSRAPEVVVTVVVQGRSGGAEAAPIAGRILAAYQAGRL
jgi:penicillin-binding protein 2